MGNSSSGKKSLSRDMILNTWATFIYFFSQWLIIITTTRIRGYEETGILTFAISFSNIFGMLSRFGMRGFQVGDVDKKYPDGLYFTSRIISCTLSAFAFLLVLYKMRCRPQLSLACTVMMGFKILESIDDVAMGTMQRYQRYDYIAVSYTLKGIITVITFTFCIIVGFSIPASILVMSLAYFFVLAIYDSARLKRTTFFNLSLLDVKTLFKLCVPLAISSILDTVLVFIPRNAVENQCGTVSLGYYGTISIIVVVASTLISAVWGSILPEISRMISDYNKNALYSLLLRIAIGVLIIAVIIMFVGLRLCPVFFRIIYGEEILDHMDILPAVLGNAIMMTLNSFFLCIFIPLKKEGFMTISNLIAVVSCLILSLPLTNRYQLIGACLSLNISLLIRFIIQFCGSVVYINKYFKTSNI